MSESTPSRRLVEQRVRNRIIEYLELAASFEDQLQYQRNVPIAYVPSEVIEQWADWVHADPRSVDQHPDIYSADEIAEMRRFQAVWDVTADAVPKSRPPIEEVQALSEWSNLRRAAAQAHSVFLRRGKLPDDYET